MKKNIISIIVILLTLNISGQEVSLEKQIINVQAGFPGAWVNGEFRIVNTLAFRGEFGLAYQIFKDYDNKTGYVFVPTFSVESRWYYNRMRRIEKSKRIDNNAGNFLALHTRFIPDWFVISNYDVGNIIPDITIIPTWGLRRSIGESFNFEFSVGLGYRYVFAKSAGFAKNESKADFNLGLRFGYHFLKK